MSFFFVTFSKIFNKNGIKVGIFGVGIELSGLVGKKSYGETLYLDPVETAQHYATFLRKEKKCDMIICLSHIGYDYKDDPKKISDKILAAKTDGIDLILGGHTHTFLERPVEIMNLNKQVTYICQTGWGGINLGKIVYGLNSGQHAENPDFSMLKIC